MNTTPDGKNAIEIAKTFLDAAGFVRKENGVPMIRDKHSDGYDGTPRWRRAQYGETPDAWMFPA